MSLSIKGQKFLGTDLELSNFIQSDLKNFFAKEFQRYFIEKDTAIKIGESISISKKKEEYELNLLYKIKNSRDLKLSEQQELIEKNKTIEIALSRINILDSCKNCSSYIELLKKMQSYYELKDYTVLTDIKYLSVVSKIMVFHYNKIYFTSFETDNEDLFIDFLLSNEKFTDYSFDFNSTSENKISEKELMSLIERENIWKNIYALIISQEKEKNQVAVSFTFDIFESLKIEEDRQRELLSLSVSNIK